jgi:putative N6-adenine-specific DNA methylase
LAIPSRIYERVTRFKCFTFEQLEIAMADLDLSKYGGVTAKAACKSSRLYHSGAIEERLRRMLPEGPIELLARVDHNRCTISVDTSGELLHRRGWRLEGGPSPIRETLASAILALAGWTPGTALFDPMCGSGTFLIEAAIAAAGRAPGARRTFVCEAWDSAEPVVPSEPVETVIAGSDRNRAAVDAALRNAERAEVSVKIEVARAQEATAPAETGLLVCNPPYGRRAKGVEAAYEALGALLAGPFAGWRAAILSPSAAMERRLGREVIQKLPLKNGGLKVDLLVL